MSRPPRLLCVLLVLAVAAFAATGCAALEPDDDQPATAATDATSTGASTDATGPQPPAANRLFEASEVFAIADQTGLELQTTTDPSRLTVILSRSFARPGIKPPPEVALKGMGIGGKGAPLFVSVWTNLAGPRYAQRVAEFDLELPAGTPCPEPHICVTIENVHIEWVVLRQGAAELRAEQAHIQQFVRNVAAAAAPEQG